MSTTQITSVGLTDEWPTEPGLYLFYGGCKDKVPADWKPKVQLCRVSGNKHGQIFRGGGGHFLYPEEQGGVFKKLEVTTPELSWHPRADAAEGRRGNSL